MPNDLNLSVLSQLVTYARAQNQPWFDRDRARASLDDAKAQDIFDALMDPDEKTDPFIQREVEAVLAWAGPIR